MDNITDSHLSFRQRADTGAFTYVEYEQDQHQFLQEVYGIEPRSEAWDDSPVTQEIGNISSVQGRLLTFSNILQHRVAPFELADKTKPGHRKILALFLVEPQIRVISSSNVPP